jgi:bifunctional UDP-N-acetylglucosamine pyrophosphorylase/glucosamine-1-phosphate N-acetyltransferase
VTVKKAAIILAAGKGKRMKSDLPKVLHTINGRPLVSILLDTVAKLEFERIVVVIGHQGEQVKEKLRKYPVEFAWQHEQKGTGDAVKAAERLMADFEGTTVVINGDVPFLSTDSINKLLDQHEKTGAAATCLSAFPHNPREYGRIIRDGDTDRLKRIVEYNDASPEIRQIREINTGTFCFDNQLLFDALRDVRDNNVQGEYYITDVIKILHDRGHRVSVVTIDNPDEAEGVNSVEELEQMATIFGNRA